MADPLNLPQNGNINNHTQDDRVIWEDGTWAIIEAGDCWDGLVRTKTRDNLGDAIAAQWDPNGIATMPGANSIAKRAMVKVRLADVLAAPKPVNPNVSTVGGALPKPKDFKTDPVAPVSPFLPKPYKGKDIPEFPHICILCGGRFYRGLDKIVHESTEHTPLKGACPGSSQSQSQVTSKPRKAVRQWP